MLLGWLYSRRRDPKVESVCLASSLMINSKKTMCHFLHLLNPSAAITACSLDLPLDASWWEAFLSSKSPPCLLHLTGYYGMIEQMTHFFFLFLILFYRWVTYGVHPALEMCSNLSRVYSLVDPSRESVSVLSLYFSGFGLGRVFSWSQLECTNDATMQVPWLHSWAWEPVLTAPPAWGTVGIG